MSLSVRDLGVSTTTPNPTAKILTFPMPWSETTGRGF